jgi:putative membrane protein
LKKQAAQARKKSHVHGKSLAYMGSIISTLPLSHVQGKILESNFSQRLNHVGGAEMSKGKVSLIALAAVCMFMFVAVLSQARQGQNMNGNKNMGAMGMALSSMDRNFMTEAAAGGMAEVAMGRLALEHASSDAVKQYAQHMVDDHTKANEELMQLASTKGVTLPTGPDAKHQAMMTKMQAMSGAAFDREYVKNSGVKDHEKMEKLFQKESTGAKDADAKAFAAKTLPTVQEHLRMAREMTTSMMGAKDSKTMKH